MANTNAVEPITLTGANITSAMDAYIHSASLGKDVIFAHGKNMEAEVVDNNNVRIRDGLLANQGHFLRIKPGQYENLTVSSGTQGEKRCDSIIAEFKIDAVGEKHEIKIIKGKSGVTETPPVLILEDLENGGTTRQMELYRIHLEGINITRIERVANYVGFKRSTEEQWTGEYHTDGKKIYSKTFENISVPKVGDNSIAHNLNIDTYIGGPIDATCYVANQSINIRPLPYYDGSGRLWVSNLTSNFISVYASWTTNMIWFTLKYTKKDE